MHIRELLNSATAQLAGYSDSPALDAQLLLAQILQVDRTKLLAWPQLKVEPEQQTQFEQAVQRRLRGEPVALCFEFWLR